MVAQLAHMRGIRTISLVRRRRAESVPGTERSLIVETEAAADLTQRIRDITQGHGLSGAIDCVGGPLLTTLVRNLALGGRIVIYGGFSDRAFELHNFDLLMRVAALDSYAYRYFFDPPAPEGAEELSRMFDISSTPGFSAHVGGWHVLDDFEQAVRLSIERPELGKRFFRM